ncbi:MAG: restriction endonuclease subunit S [Gammaproteobacteria bacterium]
MSLVALGEIAEIQLGKMLSPKAKSGEGTAFPYLRNQNVQWGHFQLADLASMEFSERERDKFRLRAGDLLVCEGGEPGRCAVWVGQRTDCYYQKALHRVRPYPNKADPEFLSLWIRHQAFVGAFEDQNAKTTIAHLPLVRLEQLLIPDVSLADQRRIAARLKAQLAAVEQARQAAQARAGEIEALQQAIFRQVFAATDGQPRIRLGDLSRTTSGSTPSRDRVDYWEPAVHPWVRTAEVAFEPITTTAEGISTRALRECSLSVLPVGTVLVAMYGQGKTRGQSAVLRIAATTNQACFAILPGERHDPQYLQFWLRHSYRALRELSEARGGNQSNLNGEILNDFKVPLIPLPAQQRIVAELTLQLAAIEQMRVVAHAQLADIEALPARLLAGAFDPDHFADISKMVDERNSDHFGDVLDMVGTEPGGRE